MIYENYEIAAKADELKQMFDNTELFLPRSYTQRFSEWNNLRHVVETVLDEYKDLCDEVEKERDEKKEVEDKKLELIRGIRDIQADMDNWDDILEIGTPIDDAVARVYKQLDQLVAGEPIVKKVKTKKR